MNDFNEERYTDKSCFLEPIYNSTKNIKNNVIRSIIHKAHTIFYNELKISDIKSPPEWLPKKILDENNILYKS